MLYESLSALSLVSVSAFWFFNGAMVGSRVFAVQLCCCEQWMGFGRTSPDCEDLPYLGAGGFYAIDN